MEKARSETLRAPSCWEGESSWEFNESDLRLDLNAEMVLTTLHRPSKLESRTETLSAVDTSGHRLVPNRFIQPHKVMSIHYEPTRACTSL